MAEAGQAGNLGEHEAVKRAEMGKEAGYQPPPAELKLIRATEDEFSRYKKFRKRYDEKWLDRYKMFRGKQWKESRPSYRHSEVINMVFQTIQSTVPLLTDSRPRFEFQPTEPQDREFSDLLSDVAESDWDNGNWLMEVTAALYDAHFYGLGYWHECFNPTLDYNAGGIVIERADPFYCFPEPEAKDVNRARGGDLTQGFIYAEPMDLREIRRRYPELGKYVKADTHDFQRLNRTDIENLHFKSPVDSRVIMEGGGESFDLDESTDNQAVLITRYWRCEETEQLDVPGEPQPVTDGVGNPVIGPDGQPLMAPTIQKVTKLKYPTGRKTVVASGVLLEDGPNDREDGLWPYARVLNYVLPGEFYGISEVEQLEGPQRTFNKIFSFALDVMTLMGNPIWKVPVGSDVDTDNLYNRPGLVVEYAGAQPPTREEGVQLQPYVLQLADRLKVWFDGVSGVTDVTRGATPGSVSAASAISELQEAAQTRIRLKSRLLDAALHDVGVLYKNDVLQHYDAPRIFRVTGKEGGEKYFKMHIQPTDDGGKIAKVQPYSKEPVTGAYVEGPIREMLLRGNFDVKVQTGSSLAFAKDRKARLAFELMKAGAIDQLELLKGVEYPNYQQVYEDVKKRQMEQMAEQAAMAGPVPGDPGAPPPGPMPAA